MKARRASEVNAAVRRMYLDVRADGCPVVRCHSDRARELCNATLRDWLREREVLPTTGEGQTPQRNGRAEATVKFLMSQAKMLLSTSGLPRAFWPLTMRYACWRHRETVFGRGSSIEAFGTPMHVRTKRYGQPSSDVQHGQLVRGSRRVAT